jgi:hypothetical protein
MKVIGAYDINRVDPVMGQYLCEWGFIPVCGDPRTAITVFRYPRLHRFLTWLAEKVR